MALILRYMRLTDIQQVVAIDKVSFNPAWSPRSYAYEIAESNYSHMVVLESIDENPANASPPRHTPNGAMNSVTNPFKRFIKSLAPRSNVQRRGTGESTIVGYGGLWNIVDEAHISTIAIRPDARGRGWGELLLVGMIRKSIVLKAAYIVLEVRVSNVTAQNLYHKYQFTQWGIKPRYYHNNGEDAFDMRCDLSDPVYHQWIEGRYSEIVAAQRFVDQYTTTPHPPNRLY